MGRVRACFRHSFARNDCQVQANSRRRREIKTTICEQQTEHLINGERVCPVLRIPSLLSVPQHKNDVHGQTEEKLTLLIRRVHREIDIQTDRHTHPLGPKSAKWTNPSAFQANYLRIPTRRALGQNFLLFTYFFLRKPFCDVLWSAGNTKISFTSCSFSPYQISTVWHHLRHVPGPPWMQKCISQKLSY